MRKVFRNIRDLIRRNASLVKKALLCLLLLALCAVPALFVNNIIGWIPALVVVCGVVYLFAYSAVIRRCVSFEELSSLSDCERGSRIDFTVRLKNKSPLLLSRVEPSFYISDLFGDEESTMDRVTTLAPFEERDFEFAVRFDHIGTYSAGLRRIRVFDLLGLFSFTIENAKRYEVTVAPRIYDVSRMQVANELTSESQKMLASVISDGMDYAGMRDYTMGDPMKSVHWKMSARNKKLMTKLFETFINPTMAIVVDLHTYPYDSETKMCVYDAVVEAAFSIDHYARGAQIDSELVYRDRHGRTVRHDVRDVAEYSSLCNEMPKITSDELEGVAVELLNSEISNGRGANNLVICTSCFDNALVSSLVNARNRGRNPMLVGIVPAAMPKEDRREITKPLRQLDDATVPYFIVNSADELREELR